jgi:predicted metalloprotease with PDZ domain
MRVVPEHYLSRGLFGALSLALFIFSPAASAEAQAKSPINYIVRINPADLSGFEVEMRIPNPQGPVGLAMAAHPEYDDRYWRYVEDFRAESGGNALMATHVEDAVWKVPASSGLVIVKYRIHLPPQTTPIRAAWRPFLSRDGGLVGDVHSFMYVVDRISVPARVTLEMPDDWQVASGLDPTSTPKTFTAPSTELLLDCPILVGKFQSWDFKVNGISHRVAYYSLPDTVAFDRASFQAGVQKLVTEALKMLGKPPYRNYTFIYQDGAAGALEHLNSVTIGARSQSLARRLTDVFATTAHEYFHTWNLMHVRPVERVGVSSRPAPPTAELWWSEGVTIYFADLLLRRAGLPVFQPTRIAQLENTIGAYLATPGNARVSPEQASRAIDNPLALGDDSADVYLQGQLLGLFLDLQIRHSTKGRQSLDDVMRLLSRRFTPQRGMSGGDIERAVSDVCGCDIHPFFETNIRQGHQPDIDHYLQLVGLRPLVTWSRVINDAGTPEPDRRISVFNLPSDLSLTLRIMTPASVWGRAGIHTGDKLVAVDQRAIQNAQEFRAWIQQLQVGAKAEIEVLRKAERKRITVVVESYERPGVKISEIAGTTPEQVKLRDQWLSATP